MSTVRPGTVAADGTIEWRDEQSRLHRAAGPARVFPSGGEEWFGTGSCTARTAPPVVHANGSVKYYRDGVRHRDPEEGPAATYPDGRRIWFVEGVKVREEHGA